MITLKSEKTTPHRIRFTVSNDGPNVSPLVIDKILKPFFIDEDVMNHSVGMGLGLTICQAILKSHASQLHIENLTGGVQVFFEISCL